MRNSFLHTLVFLLLLSLQSVLSFAQDYSLRYLDESNGLSHHHCTRVLQDSTGIMWIATYNGLNRFDGYRFVTFKAEEADELNTPSDRIRKIKLTDGNNILCLIDDSVVLFNTHTSSFEAVQEQGDKDASERMKSRKNPDLWVEKDQYSSLGNLRLKDIRFDYTDRQGNHWLIDDHGLYVATPVPTRGTRINNEEVRAMRQLRNGTVLASVRGTKQLAVYDSTLQPLGYVRSDGRMISQLVPFGSQVYCLYESRDNHYAWIGCKPGCLLEGNNDSVAPKMRQHKQVRNVYDVVEDSDGNTWAASFGFGLWKGVREKDTGEWEFTQVPGTEDMRIRRLLVTDDNTLLAATENGLQVVQNDKVTLHQREGGNPNSLSSSALMCLTFFGGHLYIGTEGGGINRLVSDDIHAQPLEFEHITKADGLGSDIVYEFMPWSENELLIQCNNALSILNTQNGSIANYGKSFFRSAEDKPFNLGEVPPIDLGNGTVLIAPNDGLLLLDKTELRPETDPVRIALSSFAVEGKENFAVDECTHLTLAPNERSLGIQFAALDYRGTSDIRYQTRFYAEGEDDEPWSAPSEMSQVLMQDMTPGDYVFEVRSTNALGQWQDNMRRLYVTVQPTFFESSFGQGMMLGLLILITLVITATVLQLRYVRQKRAETLNAYLELQERLTETERQNDTNEPLPVPEILAPGYTSENEKFLNTLHSFLEENIDNSYLTIDDLALKTNMSRSTLNRKMHELFNLSAKDFIQAARIKHACHLLKTTDMPAKEVAYACGFSDPRYFSKSFKANTGKTPTEFRDNGEDSD